MAQKVMVGMGLISFPLGNNNKGSRKCVKVFMIQSLQDINITKVYAQHVYKKIRGTGRNTTTGTAVSVTIHPNLACDSAYLWQGNPTVL